MGWNMSTATTRAPRSQYLRTRRHRGRSDKPGASVRGPSDRDLPASGVEQGGHRRLDGVAARSALPTVDGIAATGRLMRIAGAVDGAGANGSGSGRGKVRR